MEKRDVETCNVRKVVCVRVCVRDGETEGEMKRESVRDILHKSKIVHRISLKYSFTSQAFKCYRFIRHQPSHPLIHTYLQAYLHISQTIILSIYLYFQAAIGFSFHLSIFLLYHFAFSLYIYVHKCMYMYRNNDIVC